MSKEISILSLDGEIFTNNNGISKIIALYEQASQHYNETISINFYEMDWIDANLSALLRSVIYKSNS